jgi:hypothetical protein
VLPALCLLLTAVPATAAPVLRSAEVQVAFASADACEVHMTLAIDGASEVEHRLDAWPMGRDGVDLLEVQGAESSGDLRAIGRTLALVVRPSRAAYALRYRTKPSTARAHRCPLWLPAIPTDGLSRSISLRVEIPPTAVPGRAMPALRWTGSAGVATLAHLPAFVDVPFAATSETPGWDIGQQMDAVALAAIAGALAGWTWRRRRRSGALARRSRNRFRFFSAV